MSDSRMVIVCLSQDEPLDWFSASEILDWHKLPSGTPHPVFTIRRRWFSSWVSRWSARHLIRVERRCGAVVRAAGGRLRRLDLTATISRAHTEAIARWRIWAQVVRNTPVARPWQYFLAQHQANPDKVNYEEAVRRFEAQSRVLAMLAYNTHPVSRVKLDPYEVDAYQAGETTYTIVHWQGTICGDAIVTDDGRLLRPQSTSLADRLRYLAEASSYVHTLRRRHQIIALMIPAES